VNQNFDLKRLTVAYYNLIAENYNLAYLMTNLALFTF